MMTTCLHLLFLTCVVMGRNDLPDHRFFLGQIIETYGNNGSISLEGFERLYRRLGLGNSNLEIDSTNVSKTTNTISDQQAAAQVQKQQRTERQISENNTVACETQEELAKLFSQHNEVPLDSANISLPQHRCLSPKELLAVYGLPRHSVTLSPLSFLHICPAIIYELDQRTCVWSSEDAGGSHGELTSSISYTTWVFSTLTVVIISLSGLASVALVPLLHKSFVSQLINFLVALAVGTLLGDAFLHLIPHALESHEPNTEHGHKDAVMKTGLTFLTTVFFFLFESVLNVFHNTKEKRRVQDKLKYVAVDININEKEMLEIGGESHQHSHGHREHNNVALMVIMGDGLHNLTDGLAIGAAFSGGLAPGFATALAVFTHELPHELGDFAVLLQSGMNVRKAVLYNLLSSILSFLGTLIGLVIGNFGDATRWIYAVTAGAFIYIALSNLIPEMNKQTCNWRSVILRLSGILSGGALMCCIALFEHDIHDLFL